MLTLAVGPALIVAAALERRIAACFACLVAEGPGGEVAGRADVTAVGAGVAEQTRPEDLGVGVEGGSGELSSPSNQDLRVGDMEGGRGAEPGCPTRRYRPRGEWWGTC